MVIGVGPSYCHGQGPPHYWTIDLALGPVSTGVCKKCGESRQFENSLGVEPDKLRTTDRLFPRRESGSLPRGFSYEGEYEE